MQTIGSRLPDLKELNISRAVVTKRKKTLGKFSEKKKDTITSAKGSNNTDTDKTRGFYVLIDSAVHKKKKVIIFANDTLHDSNQATVLYL